MILETYGSNATNPFSVIGTVGEFFRYRDQIISRYDLRHHHSDNISYPSQKLTNLEVEKQMMKRAKKIEDVEAIRSVTIDSITSFRCSVRDEVYVDLIDRIYGKKPDITITEAAKEIYQFHCQSASIPTIQRFLYSFFSAFTDGYFVYGTNGFGESASILYKIKPCESII